jgi:hypothetical protein
MWPEDMGIAIQEQCFETLSISDASVLRYILIQNAFGCQALSHFGSGAFANSGQGRQPTSRQGHRRGVSQEGEERLYGRGSQSAVLRFWALVWISKDQRVIVLAKPEMEVSGLIDKVDSSLGKPFACRAVDIPGQ